MLDERTPMDRGTLALSVTAEGAVDVASIVFAEFGGRRDAPNLEA